MDVPVSPAAEWSDPCVLQYVCKYRPIFQRCFFNLLWIRDPYPIISPSLDSPGWHGALYQWSALPCLWSVKEESPHMWQSHSLSKWLAQPQASQAESCFAQFLRNLLWTGKSKGKCHWATTATVENASRKTGSWHSFWNTQTKWKSQMSWNSWLFVHLRARTVSIWTHLPRVFCWPQFSCPHGGNPLIPAQTGVKCHWVMGGMSLPHFVLGWMTATGVGRGGKGPLRFCTAPAVVSALC